MTGLTRTHGRLGRGLAAGVLVALVGLAPVPPANAADGFHTGPVAPPAGVAPVTGQSGAFLAATHAERRGDLAAAAYYFSQALTADPHDMDLARRTLNVMVRAGHIDAALGLGDQLRARSAGDHLLWILTVAQAVRGGDLDRAMALLDETEWRGVGRYLQPITRAWLQAASDDLPGALATLAPFEDGPALGAVVQQHKAHILARAGDAEGAEAAFAKAGDRAQGLRLVWSMAVHQARSGDVEGALVRLADFQERFRSPLLLLPLAEAVRDGRAIEAPVATAAHGFAEALYQIADALRHEDAHEIANFYARVALYLRPGFDLAHMLIGDIQSDLELYAQARDSYGAVAAPSPMVWLAQLDRARMLRLIDQPDRAIAELERMAAQLPTQSEPVEAIADIQRFEGRFEEAVVTYARAAALLADGGDGDWSFLFRRGIALERSKRWEEAEQDLLRALELRPDHAQILNYLGYSWIDRGENLDEGEAMVREAVALRPNDGHIVDSLGWALYRTGRIDEAVATLERAVRLEPIDPVINDHLGDAYWVAGRENEARFQWLRALREADEPDLIARIEEKLASGLTETGILRDIVTSN